MAASWLRGRISVMPLLVCLILWASLSRAHGAQLADFSPNQDLAALGPRQSSGNAGQSEYLCDSKTPCKNGACCGESGWCGYGPTYCGDGCSSNCNATAECGQYSAGGNLTCPLNVCCSQFGFCGSTDDFCGTGCQSNCGSPNRPSGQGGDVRDNVIGYYESWKSSGSECGVLDPSQLPVGALNAINFAFAYITPDTYDIVPMPGKDFDLVSRVANAKMRNPDTKIWVSIGGWSFSDNYTTTQPVFPDICSSLTKMANFAHKLSQFMSQYGFDGVDLDWEYPGAGDRGGKGADDVKHYPQLIQMIKTRFFLDFKPWRVSITVPTSYWYLRWFDLPNLAKWVDFFNLMAYDLHGTWDSSDPIGAYVYAHTNLTEIDLALDLFWRENIESTKINLGLAFYGRSFELKDPSCREPGCAFTGPGAQGPCTQTAGILSYREIQDILNNQKASSYSVYDSNAGVNYLVYNQTSWVSFDDRTTFQQKIDFANNRGLRGLFIWAIDQDTDDFAALKAVTGRDLAPSINQSSTLGNWNVDQCFITPCGTPCQFGFVKLTGLNLDKDGNECDNAGDNSQQRSLCCPPWGAPDPSTCSWRGSAQYCYGQCVSDEVLMAYDNYGGSGWCRVGTKVFCCPATSGNAAVAACQWNSGSSCPDNLPQQLTTIGATIKQTFCCPADPVFNNCGWHGDDVSCSGNHCDYGQIDLTTSSAAGSGCVFGRQKAFCCDPPFGGTAFVPVPLDHLFPDQLPTADAPVYYEAFDHDGDLNPKYGSGFVDDPNQEPFAWIIMVGAEEDVQSLRRRDGSHLETFDCPNPEPGNFSVQTLKALCMTEAGDESNCEDMSLGGVRGTIARLPEDCGPDEWVRVVSFRALPDHPVPHHLTKRAPSNATVYEIRYDYNFQRLRRDGGEIYVRVDASDHPSYWDQVVASAKGGSKRSYAPHEWREFHMAWFESHGYTNASSHSGEAEKRGFGGSAWWMNAFTELLKSHSDYGFHKKYTYSQVLYSASKSCPGTLDAKVEARINGTFETRLDYGISLIGTLKNFQFEDAFAYFSMSDTIIEGAFTLDAHAAFQIQSQRSPILQSLDPFGGSFNIKGLFEVGPYVDIEAQLQASITASGKFVAGMAMQAPSLTWSYPQNRGERPAQTALDPYASYSMPQAGSAISAGGFGTVTMSVFPSLGFQVILAYGGATLVNSDIRATVQTDVTFRSGLSADQSRCNGVYVAIDSAFGMNLTVANPFEQWDFGDSTNITVWPYETMSVLPLTCATWGSANTTTSTRRDIEGGSVEPAPLRIDHGGSGGGSPGTSLAKRGILDSLFPDGLASLISCPTDFHSDTGDCQVSPLDPGDTDDDDDDDDGSSDAAAAAARDPSSLATEDSGGGTLTSSLWPDLVEPEQDDERTTPNEPVVARSKLAKRTVKKPFTFCVSVKNPETGQDESLRDPPSNVIKAFGPIGFIFPSSGDMIKARRQDPSYSWLTYGPLNPQDCDDYSFGLVTTTPTSSSGWASEHVLEWQLLKEFLTISPQLFETVTRDNPAGKSFKKGAVLPPDAENPLREGVPTWQFCSYLWFWWGTGMPSTVTRPTYDGVTGYPIDIVNKAFPNKDNYKNELQFLNSDVNGLKERMWGKGEIRQENLMLTRINDDPNKAINTCKELMFAVRYMQIPAVSTLFVTQATRVGAYFDALENILLNNYPPTDSYNGLYYNRLNLGDAWRKYVYAEFAKANAKQADFLRKYVPKIVSTHLGNTANNAGGGQQSGGVQTNQAIANRVRALQAAYNTFLQTPWTNPLPAAWA